MRIQIVSEFDIDAATLKEIQRLGMTVGEAVRKWITVPPARASLEGEERIQARVALAFGFCVGLSEGGFGLQSVSMAREYPGAADIGGE